MFYNRYSGAACNKTISNFIKCSSIAPPFYRPHFNFYAQYSLIFHLYSDRTKDQSLSLLNVLTLSGTDVIALCQFLLRTASFLPKPETKVIPDIHLE